ncbi:hypothetical protein PUN28_006339 [Cardiocondyla obscurior]|uniref:Zinc finger protein n=1 Tax=Cardiocondyla obscurior TaxID=286306 RepID=A0AAW2GEB6_9HYME
MSSLDYLDLCRLCLVKDRVSVPIFEGEGDVRQIFLKITACLPVKVNREDKLPKKICDDCVYKVELCYQFWHTTANAEKQLLQWLGEVNMEDKQGYSVLNPNGMKPEQSNENRLDGTVMQQVSEHQSNINMGMMDNMSLSMPMMMSTNAQQQITSVPMDNSGSSVQNVQSVAGPSTQTTHDQITQNPSDAPTQQEEEDESSEEEENSDDECDGDEGLPIKEESEEDPNRTIEPTTFVNVSLACDEAGPSGLQQQKIADMPEMVMPQTADVDPKTGVVNGNGHFLYGKESIPMQPWKVVEVEGTLYYGFLPTSQISKMVEETQYEQKQENEVSKIGADNAENSFTVISDNNIYPDSLNYVMKIEKENASSMDEVIIMGEEQSFSEEDSKVYACDECNICFPVMQMLQCHRDTVHQVNKDETTIERITYTCKFCSFESTDKSTFNSHISKKHSTKRVTGRKSKVVKPQEYSCDICGFKCPSRRRLKEHLDRKHGSEYKHECEYCGKKFKVKSDMKLHVRFKHKENPIICDVCGKTCSNSNSLYVHQKWSHFKPKYECEICKRRMVTQENLDQHILLQHERKESFVCEECGKSFSENHRLKQHMMTHTGDRPHDCHICGKAFARRTAFRQHLLIHTGLRPYVCDICGKAFTQKPGLICHRKSHPGVHPPLPVVYIDHILNDFMKKK